MDTLMLSVVIVAYQQQGPLADCLASCGGAIAGIDGGAELVVVDNGNLADFVRQRCATARVIKTGFNAGFAGGVARGIEAARGRWVALVNDDATVEPGTLSAMIAAGERSPTIGSVAAQVRFAADPGRVNSAGIEVDSLGIATERLAGMAVGVADESAAVFGPSACCALYRREMLMKIGGFDERFFAYLEDVDVAWRAQAAGWSCMYEPTAVALHLGSASSGHGSAAKYFLVGRNRVRLLARNATTSQLIRALPGIVVYDFAYVVYVGLTSGTLAPLRGRIAGLREWGAQRRDSRPHRRSVELGRRGWRAALRQHRAYGRSSV